MFQTKAHCLFIRWICLKNIFLKWCKALHFVIQTDMGQKCHFNPLSDFFWFSLVGGGSFLLNIALPYLEQQLSAQFLLTLMGISNPLHRGEGEKGICCQSQRRCSSISHCLFARSLHFKWAWKVKVGFLILGLCLGTERKNRGKKIMLEC